MLSEGFHRYAAYIKAGVKEATCEIRAGGESDALLHACGSNSAHGLRRTRADKRRAVRMLLEEFPKWCDRRIAKAAAVGADLVGTVRKEMGQVSFNDTYREGSDGETCPAEQRPSTPQSQEDDPPLFAVQKPSVAARVLAMPAATNAGETPPKVDSTAPFVGAGKRARNALKELKLALAQVESSSSPSRVITAAKNCEVPVREADEGRPLIWTWVEDTENMLTELGVSK